MLSVSLKIENKLVVCKATSLWQAVHTLANFCLDPSVNDEVFEFVGGHHFWVEKLDQEPHILTFVHVGKQVEVTNVASCKLGVGGGDDTVEDELGSG